MTYLDQELLETRERATGALNGSWPGGDGFFLKISLRCHPAAGGAQLGISKRPELPEIVGGQLSVSNVGVMIHNALKTLRQRYGQASRDFLPFTPRTVS